MYMPLCRECHSRETRHHNENQFVGDPQCIDADLENEAHEKKFSPNPDSEGSLFSMDKSSTTKSFSGDSEGADEISLR